MTREEQIEEFIKFHAHKFSVRYGYTTIEELMREMAQWCDNNPKSPWISVEDEKPAEGKDVIFMLPDGLVYRGFRKVIGIRDRVFLRGATKGTNCYMISDITYWMPIPQVPKNDN